MNNIFICAIFPEYKFKKVFSKYMLTYLEENENEILTKNKRELIKLQHEYPYAHILIVDSTEQKILSTMRYGQVVDNSLSYDFVIGAIKDDRDNFYNHDETDSWENYVESNPWEIKVSTDNPMVDDMIYIHDTKKAMNKALEVSVERPSETVILSTSVRSRFIYKGGEIHKEFKEIPYLQDDSLDYRYMERRWNECN